jgi:hypothetical protein
MSPFDPRQKTQNRTLLFGSILLKHGRHFEYWNQPLNMCMLICYLDCHEAGLCCYLVIHTENLLCPLQLFYFHLWPIYWLHLALCRRSTQTIFSVRLRRGGGCCSAQSIYAERPMPPLIEEETPLPSSVEGGEGGQRHRQQGDRISLPYVSMPKSFSVSGITWLKFLHYYCLKWFQFQEFVEFSSSLWW